MKERDIEEIIEFAYATIGPLVDISSELKILVKSDDGGRHLEFTVEDHDTAKYLRKEISHTFEGFRTIIRYKIESGEM
tara:strand:+ start:79 stop:312 length:234 start_codon:yes stop_codon:yes gene_type:complete